MVLAIFRKLNTTNHNFQKAARNGLRIHDIFNVPYFERKLRTLADGYKKRFGDLLKYDVEEEIARFKDYRERLGPYIIDAVQFTAAAQERNEKMLIEGSQAIMLGEPYPFLSGVPRTLPEAPIVDDIKI